MKYTWFALVVAAAFALPAAGAIDIDTPVTETSQWIVGFYEMPEIAVGDTYQGAEVVSVTPELAFVTVKTDSVDLFRVRADLDENVRYIETDVSDHQLQFAPNDYYVAHSSNWAMNKIGLPTAWDRTLGSTSIKDGHIDSGMVIGHEDLSGSRFLAGWDFYENDGTPQDTQYCSWHGSHTMGTVAATINNGKGFPGTAQITEIPIKIFKGINSGPYGCAAASTTGIANAIRYAGDQGAHISSNSWGGGAFSTAINDAITYARGKGTIFVAAAGNGGCSNCIGQPWLNQEANVIIVTATDVNDAGASFNSKGPQSDVSAPGVDIGSAGGPGNSYYVMSGTSMATPYVAGVTALIKSLNPTFTELQVEARLKSTAKDLGAAGEDDTFGAGRIQANLAVY
ncbi:MAG TPA: S8 family serine peptidase [Candidatus Thermoplasmatota archaeon]|nr:S8 family serine peptidase [Candidatus Thermoplasmatota archaeon]